jgi:hypothetical protein
VLFTIDRIATDVAAFGSGVKGHVRLVASASAIAESLLDDVAGFMREGANRNIKVDIEERLSRDLVRELREGTASVGVLLGQRRLRRAARRPYRSDRLALGGHPDHPLAERTSLRFEQTLDHEHVGLPPSSAVHHAAAAGRRARRAHRVVSRGRLQFRRGVSVVAANLCISVIPQEVGAPYASMLGVKMIPLTDCLGCSPLRRVLPKLRGAAAGSAAPGRPPRRSGGRQRWHVMTALRGLAILLLLQAAGEALTHAFALSVPGPGDRARAAAGRVAARVGARARCLPLRNYCWRTSRCCSCRWAWASSPTSTWCRGTACNCWIVIVLSTWIGMAVTALSLRALDARRTGPGGAR